MILGRYLLTDFGIDIELYKHSIEVGVIPYEGFALNIIDLKIYKFTSLNDKI